MTWMPRISVIVPAFQAAHWITGAIESIREQNHSSLEIIVVDDGSTDGTARVARLLGPEVIVVVQKNQGPAGARNRGLAEARGEYVAFLDADDRWPSGSLAVRESRLAADPGLDVVVGRTSVLDLAGKDGPSRAARDGAGPLAQVHLGSALFRRRVFRRVGAFDPDLRFSEDHDWFLRAREVGVPLCLIDAVTLIYQRHETSMTHGLQAQGLGLATVLKRSLDRRRLGGRAAACLAPWRSMMESPSSSDPLVSVIIPVFQGERFLSQTLDSVLAQSWTSLEVVAVDDGSTDGSLDILARYPWVRVLRQCNAGPAAARNVGVAATTGEYIAFLDQDDLWEPGKTRAQVGALAGDPAAVCVHSMQQYFLEPGVPRPPWLTEDQLHHPQPGMTPSAMMMRRSAFGLIGIFDEGLRAASDTDWLFRAKDRGHTVIQLATVAVRHRIHGQNQQYQSAASEELVQVVRRSILRKRSARVDRTDGRQP